MKIFKQLNKKGYKHYYDGTVEELDSMNKDNQHLHSEIMQVIMWLYKKHGVWICVATIPFEKHFMFEYSIHNRSECLTQDGVFDSPTEAYEAAIKYTLKNL